MSHVTIFIIHRSQICKVLCAATGQEPREEAGGQRSHHTILHEPPTPPLHQVFHLYYTKNALTHTPVR